ncbi:protein-disulfide reductase DsbD family protein, partial [Chlamydiia bacterium]|nr:protein-disulfide reductase DsbD family protein [Chlamydiia bacterium]
MRPYKPYMRPYHWLMLFLLICQSMVADTPFENDNKYGLSISSNTSLISEDEPTTIALHISMPQKSHTYWRNPGDSGLPINVSWTLIDDNGNDVIIDDMITIGDLQWPAPVLFEYADIVGYGYDEKVTLLVDVKRKLDWPLKTKMMLHATVSWLECDVLCIPQEKNVKINLNAINGSINQTNDLNEYVKWIPTPIDSYVVEDNGIYEIHIANDEMDQPIRDIQYFPYTNNGLDVQSLSWAFNNDNEVVIRIGRDISESSSASGVIVINKDRSNAYSLEPIMSSPYKPSTGFEQNDVGSLVNALFIGFIGGI